MRNIFALFAICTLLIAGIANAQDRVDINFEAGATGTTINGTIVGDEYIDYVLNVGSGQTMYATLSVTGTNGNGSVFFNVVPAGQDFPALYNGSSDVDRSAEVTFPESGDWAIRVYLMGNDRDAGKTVGYSIDLNIPASSEPQAGSLDEEACQSAVRERAASSSATVLSYETSQANNLAMIRDQYGVTWRCLVNNGTVVELNPV